MGLLSAVAWQAQWINDGKANPQKDEDFYHEDPAPLFRTEFTVSKTVRRARLHISGLGYYEASLNGMRVGDHVLDPGWTRYSERALYSTYDVTRQLQRGPNCIGVTLGNGWYNPLPLRLWGHLNLREHLPVGRPRFIARLDVEFTDGTCQSIVSDTHWKVADGPIRFNNIYLGEIYDSRKELAGWDCPGFNDSRLASARGCQRADWAASSAIAAAHSSHADALARQSQRTPAGCFHFRSGTELRRLGQAEALRALGRPNHAPLRRIAEQRWHVEPHDQRVWSNQGHSQDRKRQAGKRRAGPEHRPSPGRATPISHSGQGVESYTPRFTFHAFRYVEVTGLPGKPSREMVTGLRLNADVERVGSFSCSNEQINRIQEMCDWTFLSNLFSVQSDCPHRERFGYGGDLAATSEAFMMNYDMATFYAKAVRDWRDSALPRRHVDRHGAVRGHPILRPGLGHGASARPASALSVLRQPATVGGTIRHRQRWLDLVAGKNPDCMIKTGLSDHEGLVPPRRPRW